MINRSKTRNMAAIASQLILLVLIFLVDESSSQCNSYQVVYRNMGTDCSIGINRIRDSFNQPHLRWNDELSKKAEYLAIQSAQRRRFTFTKERIGQNNWAAYFYTREQVIRFLSCSEPLWSWYSDLYERQKPHLIQMVGNSVSEFGMATAVDYYARKMYTVALFDNNESYTLEKWNSLIRKQNRVLRKGDLRSDVNILTCFDY